MNARQALVCPACGVLNRPTWEFCAKCGESLEGATLTTTDAAEGAEAEPDSPAPVSGVPSSVVLGVGLLAVAVFAAVAWRSASRAEPPAQPDPGMFSIATLPPELPDSAPPPDAPGLEAFDEGRQLIQEGDPEGARASFTAAIAADGSNAVYRTALGRLLWDMGQRPQALEELRIAARLDPDQQLAYARALDIAGDRADAVEQYEEVLTRSPDAAVVHEDLGRLLYRAGSWEPAAQHLERAVEARPDDLVLRQELAYALDASGDDEGAEAAYREVIAAAPEAAVSRGLLSEVLYERGETDEALAVVQEGLEISPDAPGLHRQLGYILERNGRAAEAAEAYRRYAEKAPNAPDAQDMAARAAQLEKRGGAQ
jgi:tetratricopeptide (TPR) repeat protein